VGDFVRSFPDRIVLILLGVFLVASVCSTFNLFHEWLVLPLALVMIVVLWRCLPKQVIPPTRWGLLSSIAAIVVSVVFFAANARFASQALVPTGDPGLYTLGGVWLSHSSTAGLDISKARELVSGLPGFSTNLGVFGPSPDLEVHLQGGDLLPSVFAIAIFLGGLKAGLLANLALGSAALLSVYGLGRRILGPVWALVPQIALGLSVAFMFFARGTYSEIIMVTVCAAGLTFLISAVRSASRRDFVIAGVFLGTASMTRIDGPIAFIGAAVVLGVAGLGFLSREKRATLRLGLLGFFVAVVATTVLGLLGLVINKRAYVEALLPQARLLWAAGLAICVLVAVLWLVGSRIPSGAFARGWKVVGAVLSAGTAAILLFWLSRPLWYISRQGSTFQQPTVGGIQAREGLTVDPSRSYEEHTMSWIGWYFGWPTLVLAIIGFVLLVWIGVRRRSLPLLIIAVAPLAVAALYFTRVSITPTQVWAFRRLLPIVTPGFLIAAVFPIKLVWAWRSHWAPRAVAVVAAVVVAFGPVVTWNGILLIRDGGNQYTEITTICKAIEADDPGAKTVLFVNDGSPSNYALTVKAVCDVDVVSITVANMDDTNLAGLQKRAGDIPVLVWSPDSLPGGQGDAFSKTPLISVVVPHWGNALMHLPNNFTVTGRSVWLGELTSGGRIVPASK
jgi:hypothetical protein